MSENIKVAVRCRPLNEFERTENEEMVVEVSESAAEVLLSKPGTSESKMFTFDYAYGPGSSQREVYDQCAFSIVSSVIEGYNGTIFAYGQTGTGKTFTMEGKKTEEDKGIIPRAFDQVFASIGGGGGTQFLVYLSIMELYNEDIFDLLIDKKSSEKLDLREKPKEGWHVKDLSTHDVRSASECLALLERGSQNRKTSATEMNKESSRSHCVITVVVESCRGESSVRRGKLNLVDLAGSERQKKTNAVGKQLEEAKKINLSLVSLGKVISALVQHSPHVPYRDSKLTKLLCDSLGGGTKTSMIANFGPAARNYEESLNTLRYAYQAKSITNKPRINEDPKDAKLRDIQDEITKLREYLKNQGISLNPGSVTSEARTQIAAERAKLEEQHSREVEKIFAMKQISEAERNDLLEQLCKDEAKRSQECEAYQKLLDKVSSVQEKIIAGEKNREELVQVQMELNRKREQKEHLAREKRRYEQEALDAEMEKGVLETKFKSQQEELKEKEELMHKMKKRFGVLKSELDEISDSLGSQIRTLADESGELAAQIESNRAIIEAFFDPTVLRTLEEGLKATPGGERYELDESAEAAREIFEKFALMKSIQEKEPSVDYREEALLLFGHDDPFSAFLLV